MQIKDLLNWARGELGSGKEVEELLAGILGVSREYLVINSSEEMKKIEAYKKAVKKRKNGEPIAYILNKKEFYGREFYVNKNVLIPRPETEIIIKEVLDNYQEGSVLDIGTGSGIIPITLKLENPKYQVSACDICKKALRVAQKNADNFSVDISFFQSDLWSNVDRKYDIITANLPYVPLGEAQDSVANFEPQKAVFSGNDGLDLYRRFFSDMSFLPKYIICEIHYNQAEKLIEIANEKLAEYEKKIIKDENGFDRMVSFTLN